MTNIQDMGTRVTIGDSEQHNGEKHRGWHGYQKYYGKIHHVEFTDMYLIIELKNKRWVPNT